MQKRLLMQNKSASGQYYLWEEETQMSFPSIECCPQDANVPHGNLFKPWSKKLDYFCIIKLSMTMNVINGLKLIQSLKKNSNIMSQGSPQAYYSLYGIKNFV